MLTISPCCLLLGQAEQTVRGTWPGSPTHLLATAICALLIVLVIAVGRVLRYEGRERWLRIGLGGFGFAAWLAMNVWYLMPAQLDWAVSLPLHICDLAAILAPTVMLWPNRWARSLLYFWALALTTQGFITPVVEVGPAEIGYYWFWINHVVVVGYALYDVTVGGFRPGLGELMRASALTVLWVLLILPIDIVGGWNYGFLGQGRPDTTTLVDALGPWPLRIVWLCLLAATAFVLVWLPWPIGRAIQGRREKPRS